MKALILTIATAQIASASAGCGIPHSGGPLKRTIESGGKMRSYNMHLPDNYDGDIKYPTVLAFHGLTGSGEEFAGITKMSESRWTGDKIAVYPDGVEGTWAGATYSKVSIGEDFDFILALLADIRAEFCIDDTRIYAVGHSNGGGFVDTMACNSTVGGEFAAFAPISGAYYRNNDDNHESCDPARALTPVLEIHGGADPVVPYAGGAGQGGMLPAIPNWLGRWAERNDCGEPVTKPLFEGVTYHSWDCQEWTAPLRHYKAENHEHGWPSQDDTTWPIDGNDLIFEFLEAFTKRQE